MMFKLLSTILPKYKPTDNPLGIHFLEIFVQIFGGNPFVDGIYWATTCCCLRPLWWESLDGWDFLGHKLLVVSGLFGGNPLMDGILAIRKPFSRTFSSFTMEFLLSRSLFLRTFFSFHDGILAIRKPFHELFLFSRWNSGYHEAFSHELFFFHDGVLAITKPFLTNFFLFSRWNSGYHEAFSYELFSLFTMEFWLSGSLFHELFLFSRWNSQDTQFGGRLSSYIYHKEYLHRIRLVKNLAS
jgi:hypothetical protein